MPCIPLKLYNKKVDYQELALVELVRRIADHSDGKALMEFHENRPVFRLGNGGTMLLTTFLDSLRTSAQQMSWSNQKKLIDITNHAYDLTLDKFYNLPVPPSKSGVDCRHYFKAFVKKYDAAGSAESKESLLVAEARACATLQRLVMKHFWLSVKEARRELNSFWSRYRWEINGKSIYLMLPKSMEGVKRRVWLENHVPDPDPDHPGERRRVQEIIDNLLAGERFVSITEALDTQLTGQREPAEDYEYDLSLSLAANVAQEKVYNIKSQRPAIRALGARRLKTMILTIFEDLSTEDYSQQKIARRFGLSIATFSRFAGRDWTKKDTIEFVPDLWSNTAKVIARNPVFKDFALKAGVFKTIGQVLATVNPEDGKAVQRG
jgi:hypothetical protein